MTIYYKPALVLFLAIAFAASPFLSASFNGFDPNQFPNPQIDPPIQPIGWAFAIWGVIYLVLILHAGFGLIKASDDPVWDQGRWPLIISLGIGAIWIPVANISPIWATILIWVMLIAVLWSLGTAREAEPNWIASWPLGLYAGWLTAASWVSIGLLLAGYGILSEQTAALICLPLATIFTLAFQARLKTWTYGAAVCWAVLGIAVANAGTMPIIMWLAIGAICLVAGLTFRTSTQSKKL